MGTLKPVDHGPYDTSPVTRVSAAASPSGPWGHGYTLITTTCISGSTSALVTLPATSKQQASSVVNGNTNHPCHAHHAHGHDALYATLSPV